MIASARGAAFILLFSSRRSVSYDLMGSRLGMSPKRPPTTQECEFGTFLLQRTIPSSSEHKQPPLRIAYRIYRPHLLRNAHPQPAPLLVVHGGPSLPSEYLTSLAQTRHLSNRAIILYDQLGCGWSSIPRQDEWYGVLQMSEDLDELVQHLGKSRKLDRFHLLGHSLGGAIGYEFLRRQIEGKENAHEEGDMPKCLSLILSNASTNFQLSSSEQMRLFQEFQWEHLQAKMPSKKDQKKALSIRDHFFQTHICRTPNKPAELESALHRRGKDWSANEYTITPLAASSSVGDNSFPPVLIVRGRHDFVTDTCTRSWREIFASAQGCSEIIMDDCAHYPHNEQPDSYSHEIDQFCSMTEQHES